MWACFNLLFIAFALCRAIVASGLDEDAPQNLLDDEGQENKLQWPNMPPVNRGPHHLYQDPSSSSSSICRRRHRGRCSSSSSSSSSSSNLYQPGCSLSNDIVSFVFEATQSAAIIVSDYCCKQENLLIQDNDIPVFSCTDWMAAQPSCRCDCARPPGRQIDLNTGLHTIKMQACSANVVVDSVNSVCTPSYTEHMCFQFDWATICVCWV